MGVSFRTSPRALRETMSLAAPEVAEVLAAAAVDGPVPEVAVLSTCNRTEWYVADADPHGAVERLLAWLRGWRPSAAVDEFGRTAYRLVGADAVRHLFRVAAGLESAVLGDVQIQAQIKDAMRLAATAGTLRASLHEAMIRAIRVGKKTRTETEIARGVPTIGSALARLLTARLAPHRDGALPVILVVGAGAAARAIAKNVAKRRFAELTFVNRTHDRARALARQCGGRAVPWAALEATAAEADAIVTATSATRPILTRPLLERVATGRDRPLLVVDASVPSNVEPCAAVELVDIDAVRDGRERDLAVRLAAVPAAEALVERDVAAWRAWCARRPLEAMIKGLYAEASALSHREAGRLEAAGVAKDEAQRLLYASFRHLLRDHVRQLRRLPADGFPT